MSSLHDSENQRAADNKALEGVRLLRSGDYEGAIAACTEAIELNPGSVKGVRWELRLEYPESEYTSVTQTQRDLDSGSYVGARLSQDEDVTNAIILNGKDISISTDPEDRKWLVGKEWGLSKRTLVSRASRYEYYRSVAQSLLAMPFPASE